MTGREEDPTASGATGEAENAAPPPGFYDDDGYIEQSYLDRVRESLKSGDREELVGDIEPLHASEPGELLEVLEKDEREQLVNLAGGAFDLGALTEVDEAIRLQIVDHLPNEQIAEGLSEMDSDDAVYILEDMEEEDQNEVLERLPFDERLILRRALEYPEDSAGRRMQTEFIAVPPFWTVGQTIDYMREDDDLPDRFHEIFVVSPQYELMGSVALDRMLRTRRDVSISELMEETSHPIEATADQEEAAHIFQQYDLLSAAVVDNGGRLVGVMTIDDIVDVISEEAEEDIKRLAGVGDEELSDSVSATSKSRVPWLLINLVTAFVAASVIGLFDTTIEKIVALAVLMPIVAGMGGNAASQTMTVTVRALATRDLDIHNASRIIRREAAVGIINGAVFGILIGLVAGLWFHSPDIGGIIATAIVINMMAAALGGILIPLFLDKLGVDPAIASAVFVTTVTDIVGFFAFLGLATWWFGLG